MGILRLRTNRYSLASRQITGGIEAPVLNVFRVFSQMGGKQLTVTSDAAITLDDMIRRGVRVSNRMSPLNCDVERGQTLPAGLALSR